MKKKEKEKIKLGDEVKDVVTGYTGIVVTRTEFLNGCVQLGVAAKLKKGERLPMEGEPSIDEGVLVVVKKRVVESEEYKREDKFNKERDEGMDALEDEDDDNYPGGPTGRVIIYRRNRRNMIR